MAEVTAIEALKDAHGLTFEKVWASIMALSANVNTMAARIDEMTQTVKEDHANVSGVGNSLGAIMESMFAANICPKFNAFDHTFSKVSNDQKYYRDGKLYMSFKKGSGESRGTSHNEKIVPGAGI
jgi:formamidopyrimidine-DNA glycosylase